MTPDEYQTAAMTFCNPETLANPVSMRNNAVLGLAGEAGEIADKLKKHLFHGAPDKHLFGRDEVLDEGGDVLWYVAQLCTGAGITLSELMDYNIAKLTARYGSGFSAVASYSRYQETNHEK